MFKTLISSFLLIFFVTTTTVYATQDMTRKELREKPVVNVKVTVRYNFSYPLNDTSSSAVLATQEKSRRAFYGMVSSECRILLETIAAECRVGNINVSSRKPNARNARNATPQIITSGSVTFQVQLKAEDK